jgi:hypothetical protein
MFRMSMVLPSLVSVLALISTASCAVRNHVDTNRRPLIIECPAISDWAPDWEDYLESVLRPTDTAQPLTAPLAVIQRDDGKPYGWLYLIFPAPDEASWCKYSSQVVYLRSFIRAGRAAEVIAIAALDDDIPLLSRQTGEENSRVVCEISVDQRRHIVLCCLVNSIDRLHTTETLRPKTVHILQHMSVLPVRL